MRRYRIGRAGTGRLLTPLAVVLLSVGIGSCGGAGKAASPASLTSSEAALSTAAAAGSTAGKTTASPPPESLAGHYLNDGDHDRVGDDDNDNSKDYDEDAYLDYKPEEGGGYRDRDDAGVLAYGHAAGTVEGQEVTAIVTRYYALAVAHDANGVCSTFPSSFVKAIPLDYGQLGPSYLRGGRTCQAVVSRLFKHFQRELSVPVAVTGVRVEGDYAYALLGSAKMPASYINVQRQHGRWAIVALFGSPLP